MSDGEKVKVSTTLPYPLPPIASRKELHTPRLLIRPPRVSDVAALHTLRTQPELMKFSPSGRVDRDIEETLSRLQAFLPPNDSSSYHFLVFSKDTGDVMGIGGIRKASPWFGWPEVGYSVTHEAWGQGYATEMIAALLESWWQLPRHEVEIEVDAKSVHLAAGPAGSNVAVEQLCGMVEDSNVASKRVLEKSGLRVFKEWKEMDSREGFEGQEALLIGYAISSPTDMKPAAT